MTGKSGVLLQGAPIRMPAVLASLPSLSMTLFVLSWLTSGYSSQWLFSVFHLIDWWETAYVTRFGKRFTIVRSFKVFSSPCASGETCPRVINFSVFLEEHFRLLYRQNHCECSVNDAPYER